MAARRLRCPRCGVVFIEGTRACPGCGTAIAAQQPAPGLTPGRIAANRILALVFLAGLGLTIWGFVWPTISGPSPAAAPVPAESVTVTYKLTGTASRADLTYTDGAGNIQQQTGKALSYSGQTGLSFTVSHGQYVSFMAQNDGDSGDLTCSIEANGVEINTGHSSGAYAIVTCSATVP